MDDEKDRANNDSIVMDKKEIKLVVDTVKKRMGKGSKFEGKVEPHVHTEACRNTIPDDHSKPAPIGIPQGMKLLEDNG